MSDYQHLSGQTYEKLYARYLERPTRLLVAPDPPVTLDGRTRLLDICSGSGAVVAGAIRMGLDPTNIIAVEESLAMAVTTLPGQVRFHTKNLENLLLDNTLAEYEPFDLITCRQAVNYWWRLDLVGRLMALLKTTGCFVFNTFNQKPSTTPQVRQYSDEDGFRFAEIAYLVDDVVHHVQSREGLPMHLTRFRWIPPDKFESDLNYLQAKRSAQGWMRCREGATDTYVVRANVS